MSIRGPVPGNIPVRHHSRHEAVTARGYAAGVREPSAEIEHLQQLPDESDANAGDHPRLNFGMPTIRGAHGLFHGASESGVASPIRARPPMTPTDLLRYT